ncbi:hypothetical protein QBC39DRAFT_260816 [Podospora conica]|nr:hypothetical protein QBC39DRAFT_260816 [Schizothecium conicum]
MPRLAATFVPGGFDDYYMPEVIAPAPQRIMPEVPQNMQNDLQRMEHEARGAEAGRSDSQANSFKPFNTPSGTTTMDAPSFSPFPKVKGENIPPSDEEKEEILWQARDSVLHSNNVSMQVIWARDTLIWVETSADVAAREWKRDGRGKDRPATPKIEHQLRVDAVNIIDYLSTQDHPEACFMKGKWLEFGKFGQRENKREAYALYRKAAENGYGRAEYRMGMLYEHSNDIANAVKHYNLGIALGDSASSYRLGMMHLMGQHGFQKDFLHGLDLIHKAATTADEDAPQGAYVYGMLVARELPDVHIPESILPFEHVVARQYIEKAAYLSFAKAQLKMGQAYELSQLGCDFNPSYSLHYYGLAARQGQPEASLGVSRWFLFGYEGAFAKNEQLAFKYAQDAADTGLATGEFAMGYYHEIGIHVQKNIQEARRWYELAAEHGNSDAKERIESLSQSKTLTKKDHETTTLTRIKSQYGSQRGKRPDRFARPSDNMPTLNESGQSSPVKDAHPHLPAKYSPNQRPTVVDDRIDFPDPARNNNMNRPPAFTVNIDTGMAARPQSAAPYPADDRPQPLSLRPKSTAPYPEDDRPPLSPHYNPGIRPSAGSGPVADRPMSAFGIRPTSSHGSNPAHGGGASLLPHPQSAGNWQPQGPPGPQGPQGGYRQPMPPSSGPGGGGGGGGWQPQPQPPLHGHQSLPSQRLGAASAGPGPGVDGRLHKTNPNLNKPLISPPPHGNFQPNFPPAGGQNYPGGGMGGGPPSMSGARPVSESMPYDRFGAGPPPAVGRPQQQQQQHRPDSYASGGGGYPGQGAPGHSRMSSSGTNASAPLPLKQRPGGRPTTAGHGAVPSPGPAKLTPGPPGAGPGRPPPGGPGKMGGAAAGGTQHPDGKTVGQGPATFEEMGIPQGKHEGDCVSFFLFLFALL